jgi:hypothetical protein
MALYADRVKQSLGVTGTGTITLTLATTGNGYQSFLTAFGTGTQTVAYCIADQTGPNWEVGTGTYNGSANTLARTTVLASSNGGSLTNFSGGTQDVFCTAPAKYLDTFTSTNQGTVPASGGGTSNFLRADGTFAAPTATAPASPTTSVQFNNAGVFGGSANFLYDTGTNTFTVGPAGATTTIETLAPTGSTVAGNLLIRGKNASATNGAGGVIALAAGKALGTGTGGVLSFTSGQSPSGIGGAIDFVSGSGASSGGSISFISGNGSSPNGSGGWFTMNAGVAEGTGTGGRFEMLAGSNAFGAGGGGDFYLQTGGSGSNVSGNFQILIGGGGAGSGTIALGTDSNVDCFRITEASGASQMGFFNVVPVAQPTTATTGATFVVNSGGTIHPTSTFDGYTLAKVVRALRDLGILA